MQIWEFDQSRWPTSKDVIHMKKVRCLCHFKEIWVPRWEAIHPVWCKREELGDGDAPKHG